MAPPKHKPMPQKWKYKDAFRHARHIPFLRQKSQAVFRGESWTLTFEEFCDLWPDDIWSLRGNKKHCMCMTMKNHQLGWHKDNVMVVTRQECVSRNRAIREAKKNGNKPA